MKSFRPAVAALLAGLALLEGCAHSPSPAPRGTVINVTVDGDRISPAGERIDVRVGEPITLRVVSDRVGELHVHSTPEQELGYGVGRTRLTLTIDRPGIVEVEDHVADVVVVQLEVS